MGAPSRGGIVSQSLLDSALSDMSVLVVDDQEIIRDMIEYALKAMGVKKITMSADGADALRLMESSTQPFDLIICDWMMPLVDGLEFLQTIRAHNVDTQFLMITAKSSREAVENAVKAGANSYIIKPFTVRDLYKKMLFISDKIRDRS